MGKIKYLLSKVIKKSHLSSIKNSKIDKTAKIEAESLVVNSSFGRYSYCGYGCEIVNTLIGNFCSISNNVIIGPSQHPLRWVSSSSAFYKGRDSISKRLAILEKPLNAAVTILESDVWVGTNVLIKGGVHIGTGSVIGMGSVVTHDVPPYSIVCGNPAKLIRKRFDDKTIKELLESEWWLESDEIIKECSGLIDNPSAFLKKIQELKK